MAYRFKLDENLNAGFRRIGLEQINRAQRELEDAADPALAVHGARKSLKRIRALLRLVRPGLGEDAFARENARFRDIARLLASARDKHVLLQTAEKLERQGGSHVKAAFAAARGMLSGRPNRAAHNGSSRGAEAVIAELRDSMKRFKKLRIEPDNFNAVTKGLEQSYRRGRRAFALAYECLDDEAFHDWRKSVQQHWRHMALLSRAWPELMNARASEARELSQTLGDDHDLSMLASLAKDELSVEHARVIGHLASERQDKLREAVWPRGLRLFAAKPARLRHKLELYWTLARRIAQKDGPGPGNGKDRAPNKPLETHG